LGQIHDLRDLATRPVLLDMIAETIGRIEPGQEIKAADLYRLYTDRWLSKNIEEERTFTSRADKIFFMEELAWEMYRSERLSIHYSELPERILRYFELERAEDLLWSTLWLVRSAGKSLRAITVSSALLRLLNMKSGSS